MSVLCGIAQCCNGDELCCFMKEGEFEHRKRCDSAVCGVFVVYGR